MPNQNLFSLFLTFLRFGFLAWGGPVAQIAMIKEELVDQKNWISQEKFKRTLAVYQALPGPEAHELCVYFGMIRHGRIGGIIAGLGFMLPGFLLMLLLSYLYITFGAAVLLPLFIGIAPAVSALIIRAAHRISIHLLHEPSLIYAGVISIILTLLKFHFALVFLFCIIFRELFLRNRTISAFVVLFTAIIISLTINVGEGFKPSIPQKHSLFLEGLKAGMLSFGGAYTVIPFLQKSMIGIYDNITVNSFIDGIALSSVIPAPLVIFATYLGFLADNFFGAILITAGIFLPAFSFTLLGHKQLEKLIENKNFHQTLDSISAAVAGMLVVTALQIFLHTIKSPFQAIIFLAALAALYFWKWRWSVPVIVLLCGIVGLIY